LGFQSGFEMHLVLGRCSISRVLAQMPTKLPAAFRQPLFSKHKGNILKLQDLKIVQTLSGVGLVTAGCLQGLGKA